MSQSQLELAALAYQEMYLNDGKIALAELLQLRAAAAERDRLQEVVDAQTRRMAESPDDFAVASICDALGIDDRDDRTASQIVNFAAGLLTHQAAQLEQARAALDRIVELGKDSHDVGDDVRWREMWHVAVEEVEGRLEANAPAPEAEPHFDSAQKYREALEQIEAVWVSESGTDEHAASLKMYTIAARALNNADDEKVYTVPEAEATK